MVTATGPDTSASTSASTIWAASSLAPRGLLSSLFHSPGSASPSTSAPNPSGERRTIYGEGDNEQLTDLNRRPSAQTNDSAALERSPSAKPLSHTGKTAEQEAGQGLDAAAEAATATLAAQAPEDPLSTMDKKKKVREKRVLPPRMRRVSSLLAGSGLEEQLLSAAEPTQSQRILPEGCVIILSADPQHLAQAFEASPEDVGMDSISFFSDPDVAQACRAKALIETPEFKLRDDSSQMGKTRGGALKSEEDTSDAAYERRHRRPDNLEKKQRRLEKERLVRDRQKLRERIEQLRTVDPRMLVPIIAAREKQRQTGTAATDDPTSSSSSLRGAEAAMGLGKQHMSAEASANLRKVERLRKELIAEATETLLRYDALLTETPSVVPNEKRKAVDQPADNMDGSASDEQSRQPSSTRGRLHVTLGRNRTASRTDAPSTSRPVSTSSPSHRREDGSGKVEVTRIHARTSGGKFAPKTAIGSPGVAAVAPLGSADRGRGPGSPSEHRPRPPRPSELRAKAAKEAERARLAALKGDVAESPPAVPRTSSTVHRARRSTSSQELSPAPALVAFLEHRRQANKTGPSLTELDAFDRRPLRVKLRLGARPSTSSKTGEGEQEEAAVKTDVANLAEPGGRRKSAEEEVENRLLFAAPGALSLEQAQAMMAAAMARAKGEAVSDQGEDAKPSDSPAAGAGKGPVEEKETPASSSSTPNTVAVEDSGPVKVEEAEASANTTASGSATTSQPSVETLAQNSSSPTNKYDSYSISPAAAYMPGRSAAARERAAANIPLRRASGRVKELTKGAFGEKVPPRALVREDFGKSMLELYQAWGGVTGAGDGGAVATSEAVGDRDANQMDLD
ncbi:hypothetical protein BCV69DRAFT_311889 [Microstroma glucosiphilum]|uniref:Something about silencing protein 4 domain-containing protein n=1 Tax=Pseudomicrostroma glucosiphilum TaxID=1684307 RepID=A0A316U831_9BASI|nr:hypothetical protein BCV69DRAFT_311889 [Pseudomicrostroma glucosiphilum]PWN21376.1 hypothetical protein BCV69DRAFT_311889 [Pseudomicrostroma glucosiphilum]